MVQMLRVQGSMLRVPASFLAVTASRSCFVVPPRSDGFNASRSCFVPRSDGFAFLLRRSSSQ